MRPVLHNRPILMLAKSITRFIKRSRLDNPLISTFYPILALLLLCFIQPVMAQPPFDLPSSGELSRIKSAMVATSKGKLIFELFPEEAPWHVANFKYLADRGFYRGRAFHVFIHDFIIQGGRNSEAAFKYVLPPEFNQRKHQFGTLGMARPPDYLNPSRSSSATQFHILLSNASNMDGAYTIFGKLIEGGEVLESLGLNDKIRDVTVYIEDPEPKQPQQDLHAEADPAEPWLVSSLR